MQTERWVSSGMMFQIERTFICEMQTGTWGGGAITGCVLFHCRINQAWTVVYRAMNLGLQQPREYWFS